MYNQINLERALHLDELAQHAALYIKEIDDIFTSHRIYKTETEERKRKKNGGTCIFWYLFIVTLVLSSN